MLHASCLHYFLFVLLMSSSFSNVVDHHDVVNVCLVDVVDIVVGKRETRKPRDERARERNERVKREK